MVRSPLNTIDRDLAERRFVKLVNQGETLTSAFRKSVQLESEALTELLEEFMPLVETKELGI